jgi:hypothetical protein
MANEQAQQQQAQKQDGALEQHLRQAGVPSRALSQARAFGLDPSKLLSLLTKYGPVIFQLLEDLTAAGGGVGGGAAPAGAAPRQP